MAKKEKNIDFGPVDLRISAIKETPEFSVGDDVFTVIPELVRCPFCKGSGKLKRKAFVSAGWAQVIDVDVDCVCMHGEFNGEMCAVKGHVIEVTHRMSEDGSISKKQFCEFKGAKDRPYRIEGSYDSGELYKSEKEAQKAADAVNQSGTILKLVVE
jgi:hypothetical protein